MSIGFFILERAAPAFVNKRVAEEYRKRVPDVLVKYGFDVASLISLAANEIEKEPTRKGRKNIERNMKAMIVEIAEERKNVR